VTILASLAKTPFMRIAGLMAVEAAPGRVAKLHRWRVAARAFHGAVRAPELKAGECVIERLMVQLDNIGISSFVVGVALVAVLRSRDGVTSVKSLPRRTISCNLFVARKAKPRLRVSREWSVAVAALLFKLRMSAYERTWCNKPLEYVLRSGNRYRDDRHNDTGGDRTCEPLAPIRTPAQKKCAAKTWAIVASTRRKNSGMCRTCQVLKTRS
jgi:hypothetical protein